MNSLCSALAKRTGFRILSAIGIASLAWLSGCAPQPARNGQALPQADPRRLLYWSPADVFRVMLDHIDRAETFTVDDVNRLMAERRDVRQGSRWTSTGADGVYGCNADYVGVSEVYSRRLCAGRSTVHRLIVFGRENDDLTMDDAGTARRNSASAPHELSKSEVLARAAAKSIPVVDITHDRVYEQQNNAGHMRDLFEALMLVSAEGRRITIVVINPLGETVRSISTYTVD